MSDNNDETVNFVIDVSADSGVNAGLEQVVDHVLSMANVISAVAGAWQVAGTAATTAGTGMNASASGVGASVAGVTSNLANLTRVAAPVEQALAGIGSAAQQAAAQGISAFDEFATGLETTLPQAMARADQAAGMPLARELLEQLIADTFAAQDALQGVTQAWQRVAAPIGAAAEEASRLSGEVAQVGNAAADGRIAQGLQSGEQAANELTGALARAGGAATQTAQDATTGVADITQEVEQGATRIQANLAAVFANFADAPREAAEQAAEAIEQRLTRVGTDYLGMPPIAAGGGGDQPPNTTNTEAEQRVRAEFRRAMEERAGMMREAAQDLDAYQARHGSYEERLQATMRQTNQILRRQQDDVTEAAIRIDNHAVRGIRSAMQLGKGVGELMLSSKEDLAALMHTMTLVQGAFDVFEGGVEIMEAVREATQAWNRAQQVSQTLARTQQALNGPQFAAIRAHIAQLGQEAVAANAAAAANTALAASRNAGSAAAGGGVATAAVGAGAATVAARAAPAVAVAAGAATVAAGGGAAAAAGTGAAGAGTVITGLAVQFAAIAAAAAAVVMNLKLVTEAVTGYSENQKSWTQTMARSEVSVLSWGLRMTGLFTTQESYGTRAANAISGFVDKYAALFGSVGAQINILGDVAKKVVSDIATEKLQKKSEQTRLLAANKDEMDTLKRQGGMENDMTAFRQDVELRRADAAQVGSQDATNAIEAKIQADAARRMQLEQQIIDDFNAGLGVSNAAAAQAQRNLAQLQAMQRTSVARQSGTAGKTIDTQMAAEKSIQADIEAKILAVQTRQQAIAGGAVTTKEEERDLEKQILSYKEAHAESMAKLREQTAQYNDERIAGEEKVRAVDQQTYDQTVSRLKSVNDQRRSAAATFAKMGDIEQDFAKRALAKGRAGKASQLEETERDLLRQVGTSEALRFADEGDQAEAKKKGFDKTFGVGLNQEAKQLDQTRQQLEAKIRTSYAVAVKMEIDTAAVVDQIAAQVKTNQEEANRLVMKQMKEALDLKSAELFQEQQKKFNQLVQEQRAGTTRS
jgi:hypothetical protein